MGDWPEGFCCRKKKKKEELGDADKSKGPALSLRQTRAGLESFLSGGQITGTQPPAEKEDPVESTQGVSADADLSVNRGPLSAQKAVDPTFCSGPRAGLRRPADHGLTGGPSTGQDNAFQTGGEHSGKLVDE